MQGIWSNIEIRPVASFATGNSKFRTVAYFSKKLTQVKRNLLIPSKKSINFGKLKREDYKEPELLGMWIRYRVVEEKGCAQR